MRDPQPDESPDNGGNPFENEHPLPSEQLNQVAGNDRCPQDGDRVAENQKGVCPRLLTLGKPVRDKDKHSRKNHAFHHTQQETINCQQRDVREHPLEGG